MNHRSLTSQQICAVGDADPKHWRCQAGILSYFIVKLSIILVFSFVHALALCSGCDASRQASNTQNPKMFASRGYQPGTALIRQLRLTPRVCPPPPHYRGRLPHDTALSLLETA